MKRIAAYTASERPQVVGFHYSKLCELSTARLRRLLESVADKVGVECLAVHGRCRTGANRISSSRLRDTLVAGEAVYILVAPGYQFTNAYGIRWDPPRETAYPKTMIINKSGKIKFRKISDNHRGRVSADDVLTAL